MEKKWELLESVSKDINQLLILQVHVHTYVYYVISKNEILIELSWIFHWTSTIIFRVRTPKLNHTVY